MDPVIIIPQRARTMNGYASSLVRGSSIIIIRIMPYPPSLRRTAAKTIEPAIGASTWALGSQRWTPYRGIFTRKARRQAAHHSLSPHVRRWRGCVYCSVSMDSVPLSFCRRRRATRRGREPAKV